MKPNHTIEVDGIVYRGSPLRRQTLTASIRDGKPLDNLSFKEKFSKIIKA